MPGPLLQPFLERAGSEPERPALLGPDAGPRGLGTSLITHGELAGRAHEWADELRGAGLRDNDLVALTAEAGAFTLAFLALRLAGACVALVDASLPASQRAKLAHGLGARWSLTLGDGRSPRERPGLEANTTRAGDRPPAAALKLTSGSTGEPRGVLVTEAALAADAASIATTMGLDGDSRLLVVLPMSHSYGFSVLVAQLLLNGSPLVFPGSLRPLAAAREWKADVVPAVPSWFRTMLDTAASEDWTGVGRRLFLSAGAPLSAQLARRFRQVTGRRIHVFYGSSEIGGITYDREGSAAERGTVGSPLAGVEVELVAPNGAQFDLTEPGVNGPDVKKADVRARDGKGRGETAVGRVRVRSAAAGLGYWPPTPCTASRPGGEDALANGCFLAPDRATWDGGELRLLGRVDDFVNVRGKKVDPARVTRALTAVPGVVEATVVCVSLPNDRDVALRAVAVVGDGGPRPVDLLRAIAQDLAPHEVPRGVVLVDELPRTARGKLDREHLIQLVTRSAPGVRSGARSEAR